MNAPDKTALAVSYADVAAAAERLAGHAHRTPVMTSRTVDERTGARVFFKCENFQRMGAFKFRGAYNAMSRLAPDERKRGVLAYSSGNHAQAVALAGKLLGVRVTIVMPADAPAVKLEATRGYGAEVVLYDKHKEVREEVAERVARERGTGHGGQRADRGNGAARLSVRPGERRRADLGLRGSRVAAFARLQGDRRGARGGRRRHALVQDEDAAELPQPGHHRRRRPHACTGEPDLSAGVALRERYGDGDGRRAREGRALPVGAHEDHRRADRGARCGGPFRTPSPGRRQARRGDPLGRQRRFQADGEVLLVQICQRSFPSKIGIESLTEASAVRSKSLSSRVSNSPLFSPKGGPRSVSSKKKNPVSRPPGRSSSATRGA